MAAGAVGTTAWALIISVTAATNTAMPRANPPVHTETREQCENIAGAINAKAELAGVASKMSARCARIEYVKPPEFGE